MVAVAVLVALAAWFATRGGSDEGREQAAVSPSTGILSESELVDAVEPLEQPVYWAGPGEGSELELEVLGEGVGARVRYVNSGGESGGGPGNVTTIGSYPLPDPSRSLEEFAARPDAIVRKGAGGIEAVSSEERPTSVYFVDPGNVVQVEVYDPSPRRAMDLVLSGDIQPVE